MIKDVLVGVAAAAATALVVIFVRERLRTIPSNLTTVDESHVERSQWILEHSQPAGRRLLIPPGGGQPLSILKSETTYYLDRGYKADEYAIRAPFRATAANVAASRWYCYGEHCERAVTDCDLWRKSDYDAGEDLPATCLGGPAAACLGTRSALAGSSDPPALLCYSSVSACLRFKALLNPVDYKTTVNCERTE